MNLPEIDLHDVLYPLMLRPAMYLGSAEITKFFNYYFGLTYFDNKTHILVSDPPFEEFLENLSRKYDGEARWLIGGLLDEVKRRYPKYVDHPDSASWERKLEKKAFDIFRIEYIKYIKSQKLLDELTIFDFKTIANRSVHWASDAFYRDSRMREPILPSYQIALKERNIKKLFKLYYEFSDVDPEAKIPKLGFYAQNWEEFQ